MLSFA
jgi:hypothetical protein